jgi:hypothetical protein
MAFRGLVRKHRTSPHHILSTNIIGNTEHGPVVPELDKQLVSGLIAGDANRRVLGWFPRMTVETPLRHPGHDRPARSVSLGIPVGQRPIHRNRGKKPHKSGLLRAPFRTTVCGHRRRTKRRSLSDRVRVASVNAVTTALRVA